MEKARSISSFPIWKRDAENASSPNMGIKLADFRSYLLCKYQLKLEVTFRKPTNIIFVPEPFYYFGRQMEKTRVTRIRIRAEQQTFFNRWKPSLRKSPGLMPAAHWHALA
jgi:hypothetical protein